MERCRQKRRKQGLAGEQRQSKVEQQLITLTSPLFVTYNDCNRVAKSSLDRRSLSHSTCINLLVLALLFPQYCFYT